MPGSGVPIFQAATANLNPWTEAQVDTKNPARGPLLIISGEYDHTVPWAIAHASYKEQEKNPGVTEIHEILGRGHSLTIDHGWREVAEVALAFIAQHLKTGYLVGATPRYQQMGLMIGVLLSVFAIGITIGLLLCKSHFFHGFGFQLLIVTTRKIGK